jgi:hypothetical protein
VRAMMMAEASASVNETLVLSDRMIGPKQWASFKGSLLLIFLSLLIPLNCSFFFSLDII